MSKPDTLHIANPWSGAPRISNDSRVFGVSLLPHTQTDIASFSISSMKIRNMVKMAFKIALGIVITLSLSTVKTHGQSLDTTSNNPSVYLGQAENNSVESQYLSQYLGQSQSQLQSQYPTESLSQMPLALTNEECRQMALAASEDMKIADHALEQSDLDYKVARDSRWFRLSGMGTGIYMFPNMDMSGMEFMMHGAYTAGFQLTQPLYVGGKITAGIRLAKVGKKVSEQKHRLTEMDIIANVDNTYWTYLSVLDKQQMLQGMMEFMNHVYEEVEAVVSTGMGTKADLLRVEAKRSDLRYQIEKVRNGADILRMSLCNQIGVDLAANVVPADTVIRFTEPLELLAMTDQTNAVYSRPEYKMLQYGVEAAEHQVKLTRGDYLPTLALSGSYSWYGNMKLKSMVSDGMGGYFPYTQKINDNLGMVMLSLNVPLFNWGEGCRKIRNKKLEVENSRLTLEKNTKLMNIELSNARESLLSAYTMISTARDGEKQAKEALRVMQDRFEVGMSTLTDLLEAQSQWQSAKSNLIEAQAQYMISTTDYLRAAGLLLQK